MKAERVELKQRFVPVIITLESQEEVDSLYAIGNHRTICRIFPALNNLWDILQPFGSHQRNVLFDRLDRLIHH